MSYTLNYTGSEIDDILDRAAPGGAIDQALAAKQDALTFDAVPTQGSTNPAESGGIYDAIQAGGATALAAFATDSVSGDVVSFPDGASNIPVKSFVGSILPKQSGSGDPSPDNIRPISGWSGAQITRAGANLLNINVQASTTSYGVTYTPQADGSVVVSGTKTTSGVGGWNLNAATNIMNFPAGATVRLQLPNATYHSIQFYINGASAGAGTDLAVTIPEDARTCYARLRVTGNQNVDVSETLYPMIVIDGVQAPFAPYNGQTILLTFGSTVYAGTITALGGGKWSIQPTHEIIDLGTLSYTKTGGNLFRAGFSAKLSGIGTLVCSQYKYQSGGGFQTEDGCIGDSSNSSYLKQVFINDSARYNDTPEQFATAMSGVQLVYPLQTLPDPIIVTGEDLMTLLGSNTVWTDCGSVTELEYRADTALYVQKLIGGGSLSLSMAAPSPSLSLGRVGVLAETEVAEPEQTGEEAEQTEQAEEE